MRRAALFLFVASLACTAVAAGGACEEYVPPPEPILEGLEGGVLGDPKAPLVLDLGKPVDPSTLRVEIAYDDLDIEGNLPDERGDPSAPLRTLYVHDPLQDDIGGTSRFDATGRGFAIVPSGALPVGPKLVLLVEPGLRATDGRVLGIRTRVPFSFAVTCGAGSTAKKLASGVYFLLLDVDEPLGTQIQLFGAIDVDPATGAVSGQFTNADRNAAQTCPTPCPDIDVCRLLPAPDCVAPSMKAGTVDEHADFVPNATPPTGYSFSVEGCASDQEDGAGLVTAPSTLIVEAPPVVVAGLVMTALFGADGRASGSLTADSVSLGGNPIGAGKGTMNALLLPADEVPPGVPPAPPPPAPSPSSSPAEAADAGR